MLLAMKRSGLHAEALDGLGVDPPDDERRDEPDADRQAQRPQHPGQGTAHEEGRREAGDHGQRIEGKELGVQVRVADPGGRAAGAVYELELVELVAERDRQEEQSAEDREVQADRCGEDQPGAGCGHEIPAEGQQQRCDDESVEDALDEAQERQLEQEVADVLVEDRVRGRDGRVRRERHAMLPEQHGLPGATDGGGDEDRDEDADDGQGGGRERPQVR